MLFPLVFSAGPGNVLCAVCGATNGFKSSLPFVLGLDLVYTLYSLMAGFGLATIIDTYPELFFLFQIAGVIYIAWLGYKFLRRTNIERKHATTQLRFIDGAISQALNIKGITIVLTMYSQFLDADNSLVFEVFSLSVALLVLNLFTHITWTYGGAWMAKNFASNQAVRVQNRIFGTMLIFIAMWLFYQAIFQN